MLYWWDVAAPGKGTIIVKGHHRGEALAEAEDRLSCDREEITRCIRLEPLHREDRPVRDLDGRAVERR